MSKLDKITYKQALFTADIDIIDWTPTHLKDVSCALNVVRLDF